MASAASLGIARFNRQTLIGGGYELVNRTTFEPNPDYFAALLWRQLVGTAALQLDVQQLSPRSVSLTGTAAAQRDVLRVYAFCARSGDASNSSDAGGGVVILGLNFSPTQTVNLTLPVRAGVGAGAAGSSRRAWYVRSALAGSGASAAEALRAPSVALRSAAAAGDDDAWTTLRLEGTLSEPTLPSLDGVTESAEAPLVLQPQSYAFVLLSGLAPQACGSASE
jgi:heparanase 1